MDGPGLTVLSVLWVGDFRRRRYTPEWVRKNRDMIARFAPPHRFVCLSNVELPGVETMPLRHDWPGWWSKIELFRPDLGIEGRRLYFDLDTLTVAPLAPIVDFPSPFAFCPPSWKLNRQPPPPCRDGRHGRVVDLYNSSVIVWDSGEGEEIYREFTPDVIKEFRGDQDWIGHIKPDADLLPKEWFSKLRYCTDGPKPEHKVIMSMPDKNDVAAQKFGWVKELWC